MRLEREEGKVEAHLWCTESILVSDVDVSDCDLKVVDDVPYHSSHDGFVLLLLLCKRQTKKKATRRWKISFDPSGLTRRAELTTPSRLLDLTLDIQSLCSIQTLLLGCLSSSVVLCLVGLGVFERMERGRRRKEGGDVSSRVVSSLLLLSRDSKGKISISTDLALPTRYC